MELSLPGRLLIKLNSTGQRIRIMTNFLSSKYEKEMKAIIIVLCGIAGLNWQDRSDVMSRQTEHPGTADKIINISFFGSTRTERTTSRKKAVTIELKYNSLNV